MEYSKEHVQAVFDRLMEYLFTIESGEWAFGRCELCFVSSNSEPGPSGFCKHCPLRGMVDETRRPCSCMTDLRLYIDPNDDCDFNDENTFDNIKKRYKELRKHIDPRI